MATFVDDWARPVAQNVVATVITSGAGLLGWWAVSMTPALQKYAPFSYLVGALVVALVSLFTLGAFYWMRRQRQVDKPADGAPATGYYDDAELRSVLESNAETLAAVSRDLDARLVTLEERLATVIKQQTPLPLLQARVTNATRCQEAAERRLQNATDACEQLARFLGDAKAGKYAERRAPEIRVRLEQAEQSMRDAMAVQNDPDWPRGVHFQWEKCDPQMRTPMPMSEETLRFDLGENTRFLACVESLLRRAHDFERELKGFVARRKSQTTWIHNEIEAELRRIKDAGVPVTVT